MPSSLKQPLLLTGSSICRHWVYSYSSCCEAKFVGPSARFTSGAWQAVYLHFLFLTKPPDLHCRSYFLPASFLYFAACLFSPQLDSPGCCPAGSCDKTAAKSPRATLLPLTRGHWSERGSHRMVGRRGLFLKHFCEVVFAQQPTLKAGRMLRKLNHISLLRQKKQWQK